MTQEEINIKAWLEGSTKILETMDESLHFDVEAKYSTMQRVHLYNALRYITQTINCLTMANKCI